MPVIVISRGSFHHGKDVAEKVAADLGYECISRDILIEASQQFGIEEMKLQRAIHDAPSVLERFTYGKEKYISYIRAALLKHVKNDNVVYHGLAGQIFLKDMKHVLKVRVTTDIDDRVRAEMIRSNITEDEALHLLKKDDFERRKWGHALYGIDIADSTLYDLVLHIKNLSLKDTVEIIEQTVKMPTFQNSPENQKYVEDMYLSAQIQAILIRDYPKVSVVSRDGIVDVSVSGSSYKEDQFKEKITTSVMTLEEVKDVNIHVNPVVPDYS